MKRFKFRLQTVLEYRERIRDDRKADLIQANQLLQEGEDDLQRLLTLERENLVSDQQVMEASVLLLQGQIADGLRVRIEGQRTQIEELRKSAEAALEAYQEANKEVRAVEILKERKLQEFNEMVQKHDFELIDEQAIQRAGRDK